MLLFHDLGSSSPNCRLAKQHLRRRLKTLFSTLWDFGRVHVLVPFSVDRVRAQIAFLYKSLGFPLVILRALSVLCALKPMSSTVWDRFVHQMVWHVINITQVLHHIINTSSRCVQHVGTWCTQWFRRSMRYHSVIKRRNDRSVALQTCSFIPSLFWGMFCASFFFSPSHLNYNRLFFCFILPNDRVAPVNVLELFFV